MRLFHVSSVCIRLTGRVCIHTILLLHVNWQAHVISVSLLYRLQQYSNILDGNPTFVDDMEELERLGGARLAQEQRAALKAADDAATAAAAAKAVEEGEATVAAAAAAATDAVATSTDEAASAATESDSLASVDAQAGAAGAPSDADADAEARASEATDRAKPRPDAAAWQQHFSQPVPPHHSIPSVAPPETHAPSPQPPLYPSAPPPDALGDKWRVLTDLLSRLEFAAGATASSPLEMTRLKLFAEQVRLMREANSDAAAEATIKALQSALDAVRAAETLAKRIGPIVENTEGGDNNQGNDGGTAATGVPDQVLTSADGAAVEVHGDGQTSQTP